MGWRGQFNLAIAALALMFLAPPAHADDWDDCNSTDADVRIRGCSAIIEAGTDTAKNVEKAYYNRGNAYQDKGDYDRAIEDYNQVIVLNPKDENASRNLRVTYLAKGRRLNSRNANTDNSVNRSRNTHFACTMLMIYARSAGTPGPSPGTSDAELLQYVDDCNNHSDKVVCEIAVEVMIENIRTAGLNPEKVGLTCKNSN